MATHRSNDIDRPVGQAQGAVLTGNIDLSATGLINVAVGTGDLLVPMKIPAGFRVSALIVGVVTAFGTAAPVSIGIRHSDGSTPPWSNPEQLIAASNDAVLNTINTKVFVPRLGAFTTEKDSELLLTVGTVSAGAKGVAYFTLIGEFMGAK